MNRCAFKLNIHILQQLNLVIFAHDFPSSEPVEVSEEEGPARKLADSKGMIFVAEGASSDEKLIFAQAQCLSFFQYFRLCELDQKIFQIEGENLSIFELITKGINTPHVTAQANAVRNWEFFVDYLGSDRERIEMLNSNEEFVSRFVKELLVHTSKQIRGLAANLQNITAKFGKILLPNSVKLAYGILKDRLDQGVRAVQIIQAFISSNPLCRANPEELLFLREIYLKYDPAIEKKESANFFILADLLEQRLLDPAGREDFIERFVDFVLEIIRGCEESDVECTLIRPGLQHNEPDHSSRQRQLRLSLEAA